MELKVGQSVRVFVVTKNGEDFFDRAINESSMFSERMDEQFYGSESGVDTPYLINGTNIPFHLGIDKGRDQARLVGKLTITKLK